MRAFRGLSARKTLVIVFAIALLFAHSQVNPGIVQSQTLPNLQITQLDLLVNGQRTVALDQPGASVVIDGEVENSFAQATGFGITIQFRKDNEATFRSTELCSFVGQSSTCNNVTLGAGNSALIRGSLNTSTITESGRYVIRASVISNGIKQTTTEDDFFETILLIGVTQPEYHPISLSFSPPSPISIGSSVTIRTQIENTGMPSSPQLQVSFEYCLRSSFDCVNDSDYETSGFTLGTNGVRSLGSSETTALSSGQLLTVTNVLDTSGLVQGQYLFRVSVLAIGETEIDPSNNEISTLLTIGGVVAAGAECQLSGEITTLGSAVGSLTLEDGAADSVTVLYVVSQDTVTGLAQLHAINEDELDNVASTESCPEIAGSPIALGTNIEVTTFEIDQRSRLLYVGLDTGDLRVINTETADELIVINRFITGAPLLSFSSRVASSTQSQLFIGTDNNQVLRVTVNKINGGGLSATSPQTCIQGIGNDVRNLQIIQGNTYYSAGAGVFRFDETSCAGASPERLFTGESAVNALQIGRVTFGTITTTRIVTGLADGNLHVLNLFGANVSGSPVNVGSSITAIGINDGAGARSKAFESVFVATEDGMINNVNIRSVASCDTPFQSSSQSRINVLGVYEPSRNVADFQGVTGWVFAGTEDNQLIIVDDSCQLVDTSSQAVNSTPNPINTEGTIRSNILVEANPGDFVTSFDSVTVTFGGGNGLFMNTVGVPF